MRSAICKNMFLVCVLVALVGGHKECDASVTKVTDIYDVSIKKVTDVYDVSEGPHWDHRTQKLYFVDMFNHHIRSLDFATGVVNSVYIKGMKVAFVVPLADSIDQLVAGVDQDLVLVTWNSNSNKSEVPVKILRTFKLAHADTRISEGKVDSSRRLWIGTMTNEIGKPIVPNQGSLYCVDNDLQCEKKISPVSLSNGMAWNIEDNTFYYIDSLTRMIEAYDYDPIEGRISNKRIVFDLNKTAEIEGVADGMTIDTDGNLWIALYGGHHVINVNPKTKELIRKVELPAVDVTSVAFGGPFLDILYVTTSGNGLTAEQRKETPYAGAVFAVEGLGVRGFCANSFKMNGEKRCDF